jgi:hypothetical protein
MTLEADHAAWLKAGLDAQHQIGLSCKCVDARRVSAGVATRSL